jgi:hypothetical protein
MDHPEEHEIELYVLQPDRLPQSRRDEMDRHLLSCPACAKIHGFLRTFYQDLSVQATQESPRMKDFVNALFPPSGIIELRPFRFSPPLPNGANHTTLLAAMTHPETVRRFRTVCTLASEEQHAVLRIVYDAEKTEYALYVLTDDPGAAACSMVSVPDLNLELITDEHGKAVFAGPFESAAWDNLAATLRLCRYEHRCSAEEVSGLAGGNPVRCGAVTLRYDRPNLLLTLRSDMEHGAGRVLVNYGEHSALLQWSNRAAELHVPALPGTMVVRVYP